MTDRRGRADLPFDSEAPHRARAILNDAAGFLTRGPRYELELVATEMVVNAVRHGRPPVSIAWDLARFEATITVVDAGSDAQTSRDRWGWGLTIIDLLAAHWQVNSDASGTTATARLMFRTTPTREFEGTADETVLEQARSDPAARAEAVHRFEGLAIGLASRFAGRGIDRDDLNQAATLALFKAVLRFDPTQGAFGAYASSTIAGELKRYLRDRAWAVRVPRGLQERALGLSRVETELSQRIGRTPTLTELAVAAGESVEGVIESLVAASAYRAEALDATDDNGSSPLDRLGQPDPVLSLAMRWTEIAPALERLPVRERKILYLRYHEDLTQSEIAARVGISQMHVSRLIQKALDFLREQVGTPANSDGRTSGD